MEAVVPEIKSEEEKFDQEKSVCEERKTSPNDSEYDSAGGYTDDEGEDNEKGLSRRSDVGSASGSGSASETEGSVGIERESGDGQESVPVKKVDDDEDKKNPQYIPKRGTFYEHDDRTADDIETPTIPEAEKEKDTKKKVWQEKKERWSHDRFNDSEQAPKSRAELVAIYGYDIRNEDGPPRARRRRRYGRGPNKYTRNWEDEDAYNKPPPPRANKKITPRKPQRGGGSDKKSSGSLSEEFPPLASNKSNSDNREQNRKEPYGDKENNRQYSERTEPQLESNGNNIKSTSSASSSDPPPQPSRQSSHQDNQFINKSSSQSQPRVGSGRVVKPKREIKDSDYKGFTTKQRQYRNVKTDQKIIQKSQKRNDDFIQTQNFTNRNNTQDIDKEIAKLNIQDPGYNRGKHGGSGNNQRQGSVPPRLQNEQKGSKRYSSIRQRSLPESQTPPFNQHSNYYPNEFNQQGQVSQPTIMHPPNTQIHPSTTQVPQIAPPPMPPIPQVPVTATPILQAPPPQFAPPFPQGPPPFLQAGVPPAPFIPPQQPQIINYVPSQPQFPPQGYQGYQQQFNAVTQPTELYQPPSGITYYSTDQQIAQRAVPQKRPKAAIPIVAPPQLETKNKKDDQETASSTPDPDLSEQIDQQQQQQQEVVAAQN